MKLLGGGDRPINLFGGLFDRLASFSVGLGCGLGAGWYFSQVELKNSTESIIAVRHGITLTHAPAPGEKRLELVRPLSLTTGATQHRRP